MALVSHLLNAAKLLIISDAILSWVMKRDQFPLSLTTAVLDPIYEPMRSVLGRAGPIDLAPLLALGLIYALDVALRRSGHRESR